MNLGNKIRELRRRSNLTQEQLAASLNISAQAVSKWEMGASYPDMTMIPTLAAFFKVTLDELFDFDVKNIDKEIEDIRLEHGKYFLSNFEKSEQILLDVLKLYQFSINPTLGNQLLVLTLLDDMSVVDNEDTICIHNGR